MSDSETPIRPAATVLLVRDTPAGLQVLMQRRNSTMVFASGTYVFPGGRVDEADGVGDDAYRMAAVRECQEEAGLVVDADQLVWMAHWITPRGEARRFDTRFFVAVAPQGQDADHDGTEAVETVWVDPDEGLTRWEAREWAMLPPTLWCLQQLREHDTTSGVMQWARTIGVPPAVRVRLKRDAEGKPFGIAVPSDPDYDEWPD